jgi:hypothetical protein
VKASELALDRDFGDAQRELFGASCNPKQSVGMHAEHRLNVIAAADRTRS